jgi:hypothetical protein
MAIHGDVRGLQHAPCELFLVQRERLRYSRKGSPKDWAIERHLRAGELIIPIQKLDYHPAAQGLDSNQEVFGELSAVSSQEASLDVVWDGSTCTRNYASAK